VIGIRQRAPLHVVVCLRVADEQTGADVPSGGAS
jgi:hypothetical protein